MRVQVCASLARTHVRALLDKYHKKFSKNQIPQFEVVMVFDVYIDENGCHIGSKTYIGDCTNCDILELGRKKYDCKIYRYPHGKYEVVKASEKVFRVPVPLHNEYKRGRCSSFDEYEKRDDSLLRSKKRLYQIILSNEWDYFVTLTFNDELIDASDINMVIPKCQNWLKNMVSRQKIGYILVPEYHKKDDRIHLHSLIKGDLPLEFNEIYKVSGIKKPVRMESIKRYHQESRIQYKIYNVKGWKYGFSTAIEVYGSPSRLANYVLKYMTKDFSQIFGKTYWCSKNIKLYPDVEFKTLELDEFHNTLARNYYSRAMGVSFKYINHTGDILREYAESDNKEKEVLRL